jgi:hypothetical protein
MGIMRAQPDGFTVISVEPKVTASRHEREELQIDHRRVSYAPSSGYIAASRQVK